MRPANFPDKMPDESLFALPTEEAVDPSDNLGYVFQSEEMTNFAETVQEIEQRMQRNSKFHGRFPTSSKEMELLRKSL